MSRSNAAAAAAPSCAAAAAAAAAVAPLAALIPVVYSGSGAMAIRITAPAEAAHAAASALASSLQAMGCELLRIDDSNRADLHAPGFTDLATHVIYNKSYSAAEMRDILGTHASPNSDAFLAGFDLQGLLSVGPAVWRHMDADVCFGRASTAQSSEQPLSLQLFVDTAQLLESTLRDYERFVNQQQKPADAAAASAGTAAAASPVTPAPSANAEWACPACTFINMHTAARCEMCNGARPTASSVAISASSALPLPAPPPPPPAPPAIPSPAEFIALAPAVADTSSYPSSIAAAAKEARRAAATATTPMTADASITTTANAAATPVPSDAPSFTVASWNILSADYAHPSTFFYCEPAHLAFPYRQPRILSALASARPDAPLPHQPPGSDIECLQEVDYDAVSRGVFDSDSGGDDGGGDAGPPVYGTVFVRRPNHKRDGCLIRWRESVFELMPLPVLVPWEPHVHSNAKRAQQATAAAAAAAAAQHHHHGLKGRDNTQVRVKCSIPEACLDRLGERKHRSRPGPSSPAPPAGADPQQAALFERQVSILDRASALGARIDALKARIHAMAIEGPLAPLSIARSISQERAEGAPGSRKRQQQQQLAAASSRREEASSSSSRSPSPSRAASAHSASSYFHALNLNDLSLLTRSKHNCHSTLFSRYKKENVGVMVLLRHRASGRLVLVLCAHLFWNPEMDDVKLHQAHFILQQAEEMRAQVAAMHGLEEASVATIVAGDFNSTPSSLVYRLMTQGVVPLITPGFPQRNNNYSLVATSGGALSSTSPVVPIVSSPFHDIVFASEEQITEMKLPSSAIGGETGAATAATATPSAAPPSSPSADPHDDVPVRAAASHTPNTRIKLLLDSTLLRITKWLRAIGVDTVCMSSTSSSRPDGSTALASFFSAERDEPLEPVEAFFSLAWSEGRVVVSQNKSLLRRRGLPPHYAVPPRSKDPLIIFQDLCAHFGFVWDPHAFYSRCTTCNHLVYPLPREQYASLPFLPDAYRLGFDDDGAPLRITKCSGGGGGGAPGAGAGVCGRVRWWSSVKQMRTRQKLFQVRLDMDVSDVDEENTQQQEPAAAAAEEEVEEGKKKEKAAVAAGIREHLDEMDKNAIDQMIRNEKRGGGVTTTRPKRNNNATTSSASSTSARAAAGSDADTPPAPIRVFSQPAAPQSDAEIAAARAARKASKAELKASRAAAAANRKIANASRVHFEKTADAMMLKGDDGEYLFDLKPDAVSKAMGAAAAATATAAPATGADVIASPLHAHMKAVLAAAADAGSSGPAPSSSSAAPLPAAPKVPRELHGQVGDVAATPESVQELWWTAEKKAHMIAVERRIIAETRRTLLARRAHKKRELAEEVSIADQTQSGDATGGAVLAAPTADDEEEADAEDADSSPAPAGARTLKRASPNGFAARLHCYWQCVADSHLKLSSFTASRRAPPPLAHSHCLELESAYAASSAASEGGEEPAVTNVTPKFLDCIDYIFGSRQTLRVVSTRAQPTRQQLREQDVIGFPTAHWPSDHCLLQVTYQWR